MIKLKSLIENINQYSSDILDAIITYIDMPTRMVQDNIFDIILSANFDHKYKYDGMLYRIIIYNRNEYYTNSKLSFNPKAKLVSWTKSLKVIDHFKRTELIEDYDPDEDIYVIFYSTNEKVIVDVERYINDIPKNIDINLYAGAVESALHEEEVLCHPRILNKDDVLKVIDEKKINRSSTKKSKNRSRSWYFKYNDEDNE